MTKVAIFGCGSAGRQTCSHLRGKYKVTAFLDNNAQLHGTRLLGIPVRDPETFDYGAISHVFVASMYYDSILVQLLALGVAPGKILFADDESGKDNPSDLEGSWPRLAACAAVMRRAFYIPFRLLRKFEQS